MKVNWIVKENANGSIESSSTTIPDTDGFHRLPDDKVLYVSNGVVAIGNNEDEALDNHGSGRGQRVTQGCVSLD